MKCPKCGYERRPTDTAPDWQCPSCQVAYVKAARAAATAAALAPATPTATPTAATAATPPPAFPGAADTDDMDAGYYQRLDTIANGQRLSIFAILLNIALRGMLTSHAVTMHTGYLLAIAIGVLSLVGIVRMCSGLEYTQGRKIFCLALSFVPLANIVMLVVLSVKVTRILRQAGWRVGLLGARP